MAASKQPIDNKNEQNHVPIFLDQVVESSKGKKIKGLYIRTDSRSEG